MELKKFFDSVYAPYRLRGKSQETFRLYNLTITQFSRTLGRPACLDDLTDENTLLHLHRRREVAPATRNKERAQLFALWRFASQRGHHSGWPNIPEEDEPERTPLAWTQNDIHILLDGATNMTGNVGNTPRNVWWPAMIRLALDTGERIGALRESRWHWIDDGRIRFPAEYRKGKKRDKPYRLGPATVQALEKVKQYSTSDLVFEWPYTYTYLWTCWRSLLQKCDLPTGRDSGLHRIRKTVASAAWAAGLDAQDLLDHNDKRTTQRYLDPRYERKLQAADLMQEFLRPDSVENNLQSSAIE